MSLQTRLDALEKVSGINEPCTYCNNWADDRQAFGEAVISQQVKIHAIKPKDVKHGTCPACGRPQQYDLTFLSKQDREENDRLQAEAAAAEAEERELNRNWWKRWIALIDCESSRMRKHYGKAYDTAIAQTEFPRFRKWLDEQMQKAPTVA